MAKQIMLTTSDTAQLLEVIDKNVTLEKVEELANTQKFPHARKDKNGWKIPLTDILFHAKEIKRKKGRIPIGITIIATAVTILGIFSIMKDTIDFAVGYLIQPKCTIVAEAGSSSAPLYKQPEPPGSLMTDPDNIITWLPDGTEIRISGVINDRVIAHYQVSSYKYDLGPLTIKEVASKSPAEGAGLRTGDIISTIDDRPIANLQDLKRYVDSMAGKEIAMTIIREGKTISVKLVPSVSPPLEQGRIGIVVSGGIGEGSGGFVYDFTTSCPALQPNP